MTIQRNVEGLRQNAQRKRQEALDKVEQGIRLLLKEGSPINFNTVAQAADVSKAFLYKESVIKARIEQLRKQGIKKTPEFKQRASDPSKDAMIRTLRERIKKLEMEVRDLRKQNEVAYGHLLDVKSLRQDAGRLQSDNDRLRQQLSPHSSQTPVSTISSLEEQVTVLGVQLNSTIRRAMQGASPETVEKAIESLREAIASGGLDNPNGFFYKAVMDNWKPNKDSRQQFEQDTFNKWWTLAHRRGLVVAAIMQDGKQHVLTPGDGWVAFESIILKYPLELLEDEAFEH